MLVIWAFYGDCAATKNGTFSTKLALQGHGKDVGQCRETPVLAGCLPTRTKRSIVRLPLWFNRLQTINVIACLAENSSPQTLR